ncbi:MAG: hypothetical protein ACQET8_07940 [Bacillota bacterium]|jgi:hypothetical protein|uniref:hypothetical protein n=2 Tax=Fictibacillaceae TaxID=3120697 RepID=UPI0018CF431C|nr:MULTISPECIES: hypothetical protein [unclassified Fictibacillus]MBH0163669.1 hypothetical protein [Fictibacillus sp. 7GRE50]MBH0157211.1 hypothetical protein [Fictibacillus sp. 5RED26]MBH0159532.1 hypothetical protein [Fictibacillus sp. 26RED30]MBH0169705.1 hypothetical protein [Fictibacillus sp. 18YEL24]MBH0174205.1 hypothetical protein [Fictibacillus sp. 23RED33]
MVIQPNMSVVDIVKVWQDTSEVFERFNISINNGEKLCSVVNERTLTILLDELNRRVNSSKMTCIKGG